MEINTIASLKKTHKKKEEVVFTHDSLHVKCLLLQGAV